MIMGHPDKCPKDQEGSCDVDARFPIPVHRLAESGPAKERTQAEPQPAKLGTEGPTLPVAGETYTSMTAADMVQLRTKSGHSRTTPRVPA